MRRIYAKENVCLGCRLCEVWCKVEHSERKDIIKTFKKEAKKPVARILVEEEGPRSFAIQCQHCEEPMCAYGCITGAITKNRVTGVVELDQSKCVGCYTCVLMCQYGAIAMDQKDGRTVSSKCDLCPGREIPACVENCPNDALTLIDDAAEVAAQSEEAA